MIAPAGMKRKNTIMPAPPSNLSTWEDLDADRADADANGAAGDQSQNQTEKSEQNNLHGGPRPSLPVFA